MAEELGTCGYCGCHTLTQREHVVPRAVFPASLRGEAKFVLIRTCRACNVSFSADEDDFRNFVTFAGPQLPVKEEPFKAMLRSFRRQDGRGRGGMQRLLSKLKPGGQGETRIYPDNATLRTAAKIARGLAHHHHAIVVAPGQVAARNLEYSIPSDYEEGDHWIVVEPTVFRYWHGAMEDEGMHSFYLMSFYRNVNFVAWIEAAG
jgi:hypothetical protein